MQAIHNTLLETSEVDGPLALLGMIGRGGGSEGAVAARREK